MHAGDEDHARPDVMDNINTLTGLPVADSIRMAEDKDKLSSLSMSMTVVWPDRLRMAKEPNIIQ